MFHSTGMTCCHESVVSHTYMYFNIRSHTQPSTRCGGVDLIYDTKKYGVYRGEGGLMEEAIDSYRGWGGGGCYDETKK